MCRDDRNRGQIRFNSWFQNKIEDLCLFSGVLNQEGKSCEK